MKTLTLLSGLCLFLAACAVEPPVQVQFDDRPSSISPSAYRPNEDAQGRQTIAGADSFLAANENALNQGIDSLNAANEAKRQAREAARASVASSSSGSGSMPGGLNAEKCYRCSGDGTVKCPGSGIRGGVDIRRCPNCRGTDRVPCPSCAGKGYRIR